MEHTLTERPLSVNDFSMLRKLEARGWVQLIRLYGVLFLALAYACNKIYPGENYKYKELRYGQMAYSDFILLFWIFILAFGGIFSGFLIRDYRRLILPLLQEFRTGLKKCFRFEACKYEGPVFGKHVLFYPGKGGYFIDVSPEDFSATQNGELLDMEVTYHTGDVLLLKSSSRTYAYPLEFRFDD